MALFKKGDIVTDFTNAEDYEIMSIDKPSGYYSLKQLTGILKGALYTEPHGLIDKVCRLKSRAKPTSTHGGYVLKYKVGDQILYNTGGKYEVIGYDNNVSNGKHTYVLRSLDPIPVGVIPLVIKEDYDFVENNSQFLNQTQYGNNIKVPGKLPRFTAGNVVKNTKGSVLMITNVGHALYDFKYLKCINNPTQVGKVSNERIEFADANWMLDTTYRELLVDVPTKPCTCESRTIFLKGCQCGHLKKYQPKWG